MSSAQLDECVGEGFRAIATRGRHKLLLPKLGKAYLLFKVLTF